MNLTTIIIIVVSVIIGGHFGERFGKYLEKRRKKINTGNNVTHNTPLVGYSVCIKIEVVIEKYISNVYLYCRNIKKV